jgi:predicted membrane protein
MEDRQKNTDKRFWLGGLLIFIGAIFLFNSFEIIDFQFARVIFSWSFFMFVIGIFVIINTDKKVLGGFLTGIGFIFLIPKVFPQIHYDGTIVFAILLISLGAYIIFKQKNKPADKQMDELGQIKKDVIDDVAIFGGGTRIVTSDNFKGGNITSIFGGSEIHLKGCKLAEGTNYIDILALFGGTTLIVPNDWNIVMNVTSIFGGFSNKSIKDPNIPIDLTKTLIIKGLVIFGGGEVKTYL